MSLFAIWACYYLSCPQWAWKTFFNLPFCNNLLSIKAVFLFPLHPLLSKWMALDFCWVSRLNKPWLAHLVTSHCIPSEARHDPPLFHPEKKQKRPVSTVKSKSIQTQAVMSQDIMIPNLLPYRTSSKSQNFPQNRKYNSYMALLSNYLFYSQE